MLEKCEWKGPSRRGAAAKSAALRRRARRLLREGGLTRAEIARRCGVHSRTLGKWIAAGGWTIGPPAAPRIARKAGSVDRSDAPAETAHGAAPVAPERWAAARRLFEGDRAEAADIAVVLGLAPEAAEAALAAQGFRGRQGSGESSPGLDGASLRRRLRHHVARQIAVLDAQLGEGFPASPRAPDSARVLRDVTGLKRVIDALDLEEAARGGTGEASRAGESDPGASGILALREAIARRYEAFAGDRPAAAVPGEPAR